MTCSFLTFREPRPTSGGLAENGGASYAEDDGLGVGEHGGDLVAAGALDVHEVRVGVLDEALQLVLALLVVRARVEEVLSKLKEKQKG